MARITLVLLCFVLLGSCCKSPAPQGGDGQDCYPNDTCNAGYECVGGQCEGPGPDCGNGICDENETALGCPADCDGTDCGNGALDTDEVCDGSQLGDQTCVTQGYIGGTLACESDCAEFDTGGCHSCGDVVIQIPEVCDASNLGGLTCLDMGYLSGTLTCSADCLAHDISGCTNSCVEADCDTCLNSSCAQAACATELAACDANAECLALYQCILGCTDALCEETCSSSFPLGVTDYEAGINCLTCDEDVCYDECHGVAACP